MNGFINIIKPSGISSARSVSVVKKKLHCNCGHMGTLDPLASGVLPIGLEKSTRLFDYLLDKDKEYIGGFTFGYETDTLDCTGVQTATIEKIPTSDELKGVLKDFIGVIDQMPPKYSAKCINGKRGYELARSGIDFELQSKKVTVLDIELLNNENATFYFKIRCKGGTYIRSLCRDIAYKVGSLATMTSLIRSQAGVFNLENGVKLEHFENSANPEQYIIKAETVVNYPKILLTDEESYKQLNGIMQAVDGKIDGLYKVFNSTEFIGMGVVEKGYLKIKSYVRENIE